ncbi:MAG: 2-phosphosulfolactate phosphatase [Planctomycetes bacterium]|nr:2-phosphosulfolactate phosphatase [Planctomycetota bacterium]
MRITRLQGLAAARDARGSVVVIDVLRAFTTAAFAFARGAKEIVLVETAEEALALRAEDPRRILVGEVQGRPIPGFDFGNSPEALDRLGRDGLAGRTLVLRSSSGTQGVARSVHATRTYLGSFVVAGATARALAAHGDDVSLLAMGWAGDGHGDEDDACGDWLEARLAERAPDVTACLAKARASRAARNALDPANDWITRGDVDRALELDRFDFAMPVAREHGRLVARAVPTP